MPSVRKNTPVTSATGVVSPSKSGYSGDMKIPDNQFQTMKENLEI